jgi:hypothetical protein
VYASLEGIAGVHRAAGNRWPVGQRRVAVVVSQGVGRRVSSVGETRVARSDRADFEEE